MLVFAGVYVRYVRDTADGKNPASQLRLVVDNSLFIGFYTSQVVQDFFHQQYVRYVIVSSVSLKDVIYRRLYSQFDDYIWGLQQAFKGRLLKWEVQSV